LIGAVVKALLQIVADTVVVVLSYIWMEAKPSMSHSLTFSPFKKRKDESQRDLKLGVVVAVVVLVVVVDVVVGVGVVDVVVGVVDVVVDVVNATVVVELVFEAIRGVVLAAQAPGLHTHCW
jgi:hypothetical protein